MQLPYIRFETAKDSFSADSRGLQLEDFRYGMVRIVVRNVLADALVWAGCVVVCRVFSQDVKGLRSPTRERP